MTLRLAPLLFIVSAMAQESRPALTVAEKEFEQSMSGVTLNGHFTRQDGSGLREEKYGIEKVTKVKDGLWRFDARFQYGGHDVKMPIELEVKWAGDTPVITLTDQPVAGLGSFTVRIVIYRGQYAETWSGANGHGGQMFGAIVKSVQ